MVASSILCQHRQKSQANASLGFPVLNEWQFPHELSSFYLANGVSTLFKWQVECLTLSGVLEGKKNLVVAAPTSAGKTLVAEILMWKRLTETKRKAIYIVPFVSVGREKVIYLQTLFKTVGLKIDAYIGSQNSIGGIRSWDVAVCTIEKANNLINRCIEDSTLDLIGTIVIDEFHIIGDPNRGHLVELLITKIMQMNRTRGLDIQLIGMSATISNLSFLCRWMGAVEYITDFRPVALTETLFTEGAFCDRSLNKIRCLQEDYVLPHDPNNVIGLCLETVLDGFGVLLFCATKNWCEKLSETIADTFSKITRKAVAAHLSDKLQPVLDQTRNSNFLNEYKRIVGIMDPLLSRTLPFGVAFHHAGLTMEERDQLERGFRSGIIRVLVATSTLSSGVNLPARRVIIRSPWGHTGAVSGPSLTHAAYKQMVGRAGRQGIDVQGESVIVCKRQEVKRAQDLMNGECESVQSAFMRKQQQHPARRFKRAVLEAIVGNFTESVDDIVNYAKCTLMAAEIAENGKGDSGTVENMINECVNYFVSQQFVALDNNHLTATQLGRATVASAMNPEEAWMMFQDLKQAQRSLVLDCELHMVYLVTPTYMQDQWGPDFDWYSYHNIWCRLNDDQKRVADMVGVSEAFILLASRRHRTAGGANSNQERRYSVHMRFYTALALHDLIEETPLSSVAAKYGCNRGFLQSLQQQASTYAGMAIAFCDRLGWWYMKTLLSGFAERIAFGVRRELTELVQIDGIDGSRARAFHHSGFTTLANLMYAKSKDIAVALRKAVPFKSEKEASTVLKRPWLNGHPDMTEDHAVALIQNRAKSILEANLSRFGISLDRCESAIVNGNSSAIVVKNSKTDPESVGKAENCNGQVKSANGVNTDCETPEERNGISNSENATDIAVSNCHNQEMITADPIPQRTPNEKSHTKLLSTNEEDDLEIVVMNMSRISITPRSGGDVTPVSTKRDSIAEQHRSQWELTDTQFARIFDSPQGSPGMPPEPPQMQPQSVNGENIEEPDPVNLPAGPGSMGSILPASLSKDDVDEIKADWKEDYVMDSGDIDLFDEASGNSSETEECQVLPIVNSPKTPIFHVRKRRYIHRMSDHSTPSPLTRKCFKAVDMEESRECPTNPAISENVRENSAQLTTINSCASFESFAKFSSLWRTQRIFSMAFALKEDEEQQKVGKNGARIEIVGVAVCWDQGTVYYLPMVDDDDEDLDTQSRPPILDPVLHYLALVSESEEQCSLGKPTCLSNESNLSSSDAVTVKERLRLLKRCLCVRSAEHSTKIVLDYLHIQKVIRHWIGPITGPVYCLRMADWLLSCGRTDFPPTNNVDRLISRYSKHSTGDTSDRKLATCSRAAAMFAMWPVLRDQLKQQQLWTAYIETEMAGAKVISEMESNGICFDFENCRIISDRIKELCKNLEHRAYRLAGRQFSLNSYSDLAKILYTELNLPADGAGATSLQSRRCRVQNTRRHYSTCKEILEKIRPLHPLPGVILDWRKLHGALSSSIFPFTKRQYTTTSNEKRTTRVFGTYEWYTATGRVIMQEPSLQTVPRAFQVVGEDAVAESINVRDLITAENGFVLLSADYSQLELRILAHLSEDNRLVEILNSDEGDVFRIIASTWLSLPPEKITSQERQRAKKLCYGVIYGMGARTLAEELDVSEETAAGFMAAFKEQFPGVFGWMADVIRKTRESGYVTTLTGRRRYLPAISNNNALEQRMQAERQAINTSVQGSAADVFKTALHHVQTALMEEFSTIDPVYRFVLQLHDELILETKETLVNRMAEIVRRGMEECFRLRVLLKVRLTTGKTWGSHCPL